MKNAMEVNGYMCAWRCEFNQNYVTPVILAPRVILGIRLGDKVIYEGCSEYTSEVLRYSEEQLRAWFAKTVYQYENKLRREADEAASPVHKYRHRGLFG